MNDVSAAGDGSPQGRVEAAGPPGVGPVPAPGEEAMTLGAHLDVSPVTVLGGPPDAPVAEAEAPVRPRPRVRAAGGGPEEPGASTVQNGRRRRTGVAIATATGVVALAAAPFAVVSPQVRILGDSASPAAKERPTTEAKKQVKKLPVPVPSWQARHSSPPVPVRPPSVKLSPSSTPSVGTSKPATADKPNTTRPDRQVKAQPKTLAHKSATPTESPAISKLVVSRKKNAARTKPSTTPSATAAEHHDAVQTDAAETSVQAPTPTPTPSKTPSRAPAQTRVVYGTYVLHPGESIATNRMRLALRSDGDLVISDQGGKAVWSTGTHASGTHAVFQADGNLVLYSSDNETLWSSRTDGHDGAVLVLQGDGNLTIRQGGALLWASGT